MSAPERPVPLIASQPKCPTSQQMNWASSGPKIFKGALLQIRKNDTWLNQHHFIGGTGMALQVIWYIRIEYVFETYTYLIWFTVICVIRMPKSFTNLKLGHGHFGSGQTSLDCSLRPPSPKHIKTYHTVICHIRSIPGWKSLLQGVKISYFDSQTGTLLIWYIAFSVSTFWNCNPVGMVSTKTKMVSLYICESFPRSYPWTLGSKQRHL